MKDVKLSVVMSVFNEHHSFIENAIDSILNQSFESFEFIIVNDNPENTSTISLLEKYANYDNRITIIKNNENIGLTKSLNKALAICKGEYIARMDADDISHPERFIKQISFLADHPGIGVCASNTNIIDENGIITYKECYPTNLDMSRVFFDNPLAHPTVMIRSSLLSLRSPFYNEDYRNAQDYELWSFLYLNGVRFYILPEVLLDYRRMNGQSSMVKYNGKQNDLFKRAQRLLIRDYLIKEKIITKEDWIDLIDVCNKVSKSYKQSNNKNNLRAIMFVLYATLISKDLSKIFAFVFDRNFMLFKFSPKDIRHIICIRSHKDWQRIYCI